MIDFRKVSFDPARNHGQRPVRFSQNGVHQRRLGHDGKEDERSPTVRLSLHFDGSLVALPR